MTDTPSTAQWIGAALKRYEGPLMRYAVRIVGSSDRAADVVQETFLHLCRARRSEVDNHLAAWLFRVCRNRALDMRRKDKRVQPLELVTENALKSPEPGPDVITARRRDADHVAAILQTLPETQQEAIYLRFQGGLSYKEISQVTGHSVANVGNLLHAAVTKIRARLAAENLPGNAIAGGVQ